MKLSWVSALPNPLKDRMVTYISPTFKKVITDAADTLNITEATLVRLAVAEYIGYTLTPDDNNPAREKRLGGPYANDEERKEAYKHARQNRKTEQAELLAKLRERATQP